jgi:hypothetical protein
MTKSNRLNRERQDVATRAERSSDFVQDWMLQLMLLAAVVGAVVECVRSLGGSVL